MQLYARHSMIGFFAASKPNPRTNNPFNNNRLDCVKRNYYIKSNILGCSDS